jgi:uncharacterized protein YjcR
MMKSIDRRDYPLVFGPAPDVPNETLKRWRRVVAEYWAVQDEIEAAQARTQKGKTSRGSHTDGRRALRCNRRVE